VTTLTKAISYKSEVNTLIGQLEGMMPSEQFQTFDADAKQLAANHDAPLRLKVGDTAPLFSLPNADGEAINLAGLLKEGCVVLTFYRGVWCPYCNLQLKLLQNALPQISDAGASLVAISPMNPDSSKGTIKESELTFEVLSDVGNAVAGQFTTVFKNSDEAIDAMKALGYDFYSFYDDKSAELPVSAVFVIDKTGKVIFAKSEGGDYRERVEVQEILDVLA